MRNWIKSRDAHICNTKLFLLYLVVVGHLLEPVLQDHVWFLDIYKWIYTFHMPLFVFLSGLFVKSESSAFEQGKKVFFLYGVWQLVFSLFVWIAEGKIFPLWKPYWHLWYLLSLSAWCFLAGGIYRFSRRRQEKRRKKRIFAERNEIDFQRGHWVRVTLIVAAVSTGCLIGGVDWVGREFSLSRTIVFFPYFLLGMICPSDFEWKKLRKVSWVFLLVGLVFFLSTRSRISSNFLYQASAFSGRSLTEGGLLRLCCYGMGICFGIFFLSVMPSQRLFCTKAGADTMMMYVLHGPLVKALGMFSFMGIWYEAAIWLLGMFILSGLFLLFRWHRPLFGIVEEAKKGT